MNTLKCLFYFTAFEVTLKGGPLSAQCYRCLGNNEECSLSAMHSDLERFSEKCLRGHTTCSTTVFVNRGRSLIEKRCVTPQACVSEKQHCNATLLSRKGRRSTKQCESYCCKGYMCNSAATCYPVFFVIVLGLLLFSSV